MAVRRESKKKGASKTAGTVDDQTAPPVGEQTPATTAPPEPVELPPIEKVDDAERRRGTTGEAPVREQAHAQESTPRASRVAASSYTVVARRYRPQRFEDVVGQDHVVQSLRNAIRLNRIAQAYLFCGTRGVGKTSIARIFAKCLNCVQGPTETPCQICDICQAIASGQDVDVIEIDGASNNGVEQVRELRQNASLRPSRSRFKIYYIDEVHMLSTGAFNALLKTLEEPPAHVKFFFATTEVNKIPITVLSRCQRYDFAGITPEAIAVTLGEICTREGVDFEHEALQLVARRAGGSLRDAQSLLDRLLASGYAKLTVDVVHGLLGTASDERLLKMLEALAGHEPGVALGLLNQSEAEGVQPAELLGGLIDLVRDALILAVGGGESLLESVSPRNRGQLKKIVERWTTKPILAAIQILGECRSRMRGSVHGRLLVETALVRAALLEELTSVSSLVERLEALESGTAPRKPDPGTGRGKPTAPPETPLPAMTGPSVVAPPAPAPVPAQTREPVAEVAPARAKASDVMAEPATAAVATLSVESRANLGAAGVRAESAADMRSRGKAVNDAAPRAVAEDGVAKAPAGVEASGESTRGEKELAEDASREDEAPAGGHRGELVPLDLDAVRKLWPEVVKKVDKRLALTLTQVEPIDFEGTDVLVIAAKPGYNSTFADVDSPEAQSKIALALQRLVHRPVRIKYIRRSVEEQGQGGARRNEAQRADSLSGDPMVQRVLELFEARPVQMDYDEDDAGQGD